MESKVNLLEDGTDPAGSCDVYSLNNPLQSPRLHLLQYSTHLLTTVCTYLRIGRFQKSSQRVPWRKRSRLHLPSPRIEASKDPSPQSRHLSKPPSQCHPGGEGCSYRDRPPPLSCWPIQYVLYIHTGEATGRYCNRRCGAEARRKRYDAFYWDRRLVCGGQYDA